MCKLVLTVCFALAVVFGLSQPVSADLVGHWTFDDGAGAIAVDSSGNGNDGVIESGGDSVWVEGQLGTGVALGNGVWVTVAPEAWIPIDNQFTVAFWAFGYDGLGNNWGFFATGGGANRVAGSHTPWGNGQLYFDSADASGAWQSERINAPMDAGLATGVWTHYAFTKNADTGDKHIYVNGDLFLSGTGAVGPVADISEFIIGAGPNGANQYLGVIDDFQLYDVALTQAEIQVAMVGVARELASVPTPEDAKIDVLRDVMLSWAPGEYAAKHDVYLGTVFEDVNTATAGSDLLVSQDQAGTTFDAGILEFGQTYFWRVDEVNGAPDNTVFQGEVWSFEVEPFAIPVESVTATASSSNADNMVPENTINGVGLNELDQHSTEPTDMWLSGMGDPTPSIQYEFDQIYKLHEMLVWNSNQIIESFVGLGAKDVVVEYSADGTEWAVLEGATLFAQAPGVASYEANTVIDFGGALAQYVKITVNAGYGMLPQYGLSEVRFLYVPTFAREPQPADGETTESAQVMLSWRAGREAASHEVYLGTDAGNLAMLGTTDESSIDAGALDYETSYYWQIVEVNEAEVPTSHAGPIWSFTTAAFGVVDNFDQYDDDCNRIFFAWEDGLGHGGGEDIDDCDVPASNGNGGGSIVGNDMAPFAERTIVAAGTQSLPFNYDNAFGPSEATLTLDGQDWTASGVQSLSLQFSGEAGNSGQLYVKINNTKVAYTDDAANIVRAEWQAWVIDLSAVGGNLQNVTSLTIGVDGGSAAGMLYIDEIGLYPKAAEYFTPVDPGNANLAGAWSFDEAAGDVAADGSGNGNNGTLVGAGWDTGATGSAVVFDGLTSHVDIPAAAWTTIEQQATVSVWLHVDSSISQNPVTFAAYQDPGNGQSRVFSTHVLWGGTLYLDTGGDTGNYDRISKPATAGDYGDAWIHWAFTKNAETGEQKIYRNGILWHSGTGLTRAMTGVTAFRLGAHPNDGEFWNGSMDEFRLYNQELSQEEILWLAGKTEPIVKPF
jgi:hypothetical protein